MNKLKFVPELTTGCLSEQDAKRYFSRIGWFAFAYYLINVLIVNTVAIIVAMLAPDIYSHYLFSELLSFIPSYAIALPIAYLIIRPLPTVAPDKENLKPSHWLCGLCISISLMMVGSYVSNIILSVFSNILGNISENPVEQMVDSSPMWVTVIFVVIVAPILEELLFRGILCKKLLVLGEGYAIIISSAFFALCHGNFYQLFYAFALGCFFSFIYVKTGKLIYSILYHMCVNLLGSVITPFFMKLIGYDELLSEDLVLNSKNLLSFLGLIWYEFLIMGITIFGIIIIITKWRKFKTEAGLLPPPREKAASCVLLNSGTAAAIALFAFTLLLSLIP